AGGAYSVRAAFDPGDCLLRLVSIRDPSPLNTLDQFGKSPLWLSRHARGELLDRCRSATLGLLLRPVRPEEVLTTALRRYLSGETAITRQKRLDQVKSVGSIEMRRLADEFDAGLSDARTVILGPEAGVTTVVSSLDGMVIRR
ncbi:hypothetical protein, partial [uncultured Parasphingopyxis sp.]|uniref:hypothetical protein n=1 Tax=uncultured Parasphingopyxis sp. TaxID=1547918 RepID=UPI00261D54BE